jgi:hypothetical protein
MAGATPNARSATVRRWLARHALGLWFLAIAALGFMRWWMKVGREGASTQAPDVVLWLAGSIVLALVGLVALWRAR